MVCKLCPERKRCWDKGNCESCEFGKAYNGLFEKNKRLKAKNEKLEKENKELNKRIDDLLHPDF